jgi:hypothetical protein
MSAQPARLIAGARRTGRRRHSACRIGHGRGDPMRPEGGRSHHARSVSISRSTCAASALSASSAASASASARIEAAAFRRAASISAARTAADTGVPSHVNTAKAFKVSSSGRNVIVSAIDTSVLQIVRRWSWRLSRGWNTAAFPCGPSASGFGRGSAFIPRGWFAGVRLSWLAGACSAKGFWCRGSC